MNHKSKTSLLSEENQNNSRSKLSTAAEFLAKTISQTFIQTATYTFQSVLLKSSLNGFNTYSKNHFLSSAFNLAGNLAKYSLISNSVKNFLNLYTPDNEYSRFLKAFASIGSSVIIRHQQVKYALATQSMPISISAEDQDAPESRSSRIDSSSQESGEPAAAISSTEVADQTESSSSSLSDQTEPVQRAASESSLSAVSDTTEFSESSSNANSEISLTDQQVESSASTVEALAQSEDAQIPAAAAAQAQSYASPEVQTEEVQIPAATEPDFAASSEDALMQTDSSTSATLESSADFDAAASATTESLSVAELQTTLSQPVAQVSTNSQKPSLLKLTPQILFSTSELVRAPDVGEKINPNTLNKSIITFFLETSGAHNLGSCLSKAGTFGLLSLVTLQASDFLQQYADDIIDKYIEDYITPLGKFNNEFNE